MKRVLFTVALCVVASASFAQKKAVREAESLAKGNKDFAEARSLIKGALVDEETKNDAKTWYVAGYIEDQQFSAERTKEVIGQTPNEPVMFDALINTLPFFEKAYELDQIPDAKGRVRPRHSRDIKSIISANHIYYINGGAYYFEQANYQRAYDFFNQYIYISDLPMFEGSPVAERDSNFMMVQFYAAVAATQLEDKALSIAALERAKTFDYKQNDIYQYLATEYEQAQDSVNFEKTLMEGLELFPEEKYFLLNLINTYIYSNRNEKALEFLNTAIANEPNNAQLYDVMGRVYETGLRDYANAEIYFEKAIALDPENTDILSNLGRVYYNQGVNKQGEANLINDNKQYEEELNKAREFFRKALPYFEKAHKTNPEEREFMIALRGIYYNLNMGDEFEAMDVKMNTY